ncbi:MAG: c-type cytochrome [Magnetospirillum sp. WYHS-4]
MTKALALPALLLAALPAFAQEPKIDPQIGEDINRTCAPCHGEYGQGGGAGTYPRLAGMSAQYIAEQIKLFKDRKRVNIPMAPYANDRELPDEDLVHIAGYLAQIKLATRLPELKEGQTIDGYERLKQTKLTLQIPRADGDAEAGGKAYREDCADCHGKDGYGRRKTPLLAGQHLPYLKKQIEGFQSGERAHEDAQKIFPRLKGKALDDLFAYLSTLDD